jgi:hypothetical protein
MDLDLLDEWVSHLPLTRPRSLTQTNSPGEIIPPGHKVGFASFPGVFLVNDSDGPVKLCVLRLEAPKEEDPQPDIVIEDDGEAE